MKHSILTLVGMTVGLCISSAWGDPVLFGDLGPSGNVYVEGGSDIVGSGNSIFPGEMQDLAMPFTVAGIGSQTINQIDLAVTNSTGANTFDASIWTDASGQLGSQVAGAFWSLSTGASFPNCCSLVTIPVSGVDLTGGQQYFMVLTPVSSSDNSMNVWDQNNQGVTGPFLYTLNGNWLVVSPNPSPLGAFDVLGESAVPEPSNLLVSASGLAAILVFRRRRSTAS